MGLSQADIDTYHAERARLEPIAIANGVAYDEDNFMLMKALQTIAHEQRGGTKGASQPGTSLQHGEPGPLLAAARRTAEQLRAVTSQARTSQPTAANIGEVVCNRMRVKRGLPPIDFAGGR